MFLYRTTITHFVLRVLFLFIEGSLLVSCMGGSGSPRPDDIPEGMKAIDLNLTILNSLFNNPESMMRSTQTGALRVEKEEPGDYDAEVYGADPLNENKIEDIQIFLFKQDADGTLLRAFSKDKVTKINEASTTTGGGTYKVRVLIPHSEISTIEGKQFQIVAVVNASSDLTLGVTKLADLQAKLQDEQNGFDSKDPSSDLGIKPQTRFLMDGSLSTGTITWGSNKSYDIPSDLQLRRAASKIRLRIDYIRVVDHQNGGNTEYEVLDKHVRLMHYTAKGSVVAGAPYKVQDSEWKDTDYRELKSRTFPGKQNTAGASSFDTSFPFYTYENNWAKNENNETYLQIRLKMRPKERPMDEGKYYYYRLPISFKKTMEGVPEEKLHRADRNHLYDVLTAIEQLGSLDAGDPLEVNSFVSIRPWNDPDKIDGTILQAHFLVVREHEPVIANVAERKVQYISDLKVKVVMKEVYYEYFDVTGQYYRVVFDKDGYKTTYRGNKEQATSEMTQYGEKSYVGRAYDGTTVVASDEHLEDGMLTITHAVPVNFLAFHILFDVVQEPGESKSLKESVHAIQYPPRFITGRKSIGQKPTEVELREGRDYADFRYHSTFGSTAIYPGTISKVPQVNDVLFKVTTVVAQDGERIGDPTDIDGKTKRDEASNRIISPEFIVASQYGMSPQMHQYDPSLEQAWYRNNYFDSQYGGNSVFYRRVYPYYNYSNTPVGGPQYMYRNYTSAETRCANYFEDEYGWDGTYEEHYIDEYNQRRIRSVKKTFKYKGHWRIPTAAEIEMVDKMQDNANAVIKYLMYGKHYWTARNGYVFEFSSNSSRPVSDVDPIEENSDRQKSAVRCVFDTYKFKDHKHY